MVFLLACTEKLSPIVLKRIGMDLAAQPGDTYLAHEFPLFVQPDLRIRTQSKLIMGLCAEPAGI